MGNSCFKAMAEEEHCDPFSSLNGATQEPSAVEQPGQCLSFRTVCQQQLERVEAQLKSRHSGVPSSGPGCGVKSISDLFPEGWDKHLSDGTLQTSPANLFQHALLNSLPMTEAREDETFVADLCCTAHIDRNTPKATVSKRFSRMASMGSSSRQGSKLSALTASCLSNSASSTEPGSLKATPPGPSASQVNAAAALTDQPGGQQGEVKGAVGPQSAQVPEPCAPLQIPPRQQGLEKQNRLKAAPPAAEAQLQLQRPSQPQGRAGGSPGPGLVRSLSMSPAHEPMSSAHRAAALRTAEALQRSQPKGAVPAIPDNSSLHAIAKVLRGVREQRERTEHMHGQNSPGTVQALARTHSFHAAPLRTAKSLDANFSMNWLHDTAHHGLGGHASMKGRGSIDQTSGKGGMGAGLLRSGSLRKSVEVGQRSSQPAGNLFFAPLSIITSDQVACRAVLSGSHLQSPRAHMHHSSHAGDGESQI